MSIPQSHTRAMDRTRGTRIVCIVKRDHAFDIHRKFEFAQTSEIEGTFGNLRTFIRRMYHHVTPEKLPDMVSEFCFRFSSPELFKNPLYYLEKTLRVVPID